MGGCLENPGAYREHKMNKTIWPAAALLALCLAACGGGGGGSSSDSATAAPVAATDRRVLLSQYKPGNPVPPAPAQAQAASDYQFVTVPLSVAFDAALIVPAPALAQRALLVAAAPPGELRNILLAEPGDPRGLAAGVARRELQGLAGFGALPEWLQASALGSAEAVAPAAWQSTTLANWDAAMGSLPAGFSPSLRVVDSVDGRWAWPGAVERFEGVFEHDNGVRELRQMLGLSGPGWQLSTAGFSAQGLVLGGGLQLIKLRPAQGTMQAFSASAALAEALVALNQRLRAGLALADTRMTLGDQAPDLSVAQDRQRLGSHETLPFTLLDGRGQYVESDRFGINLSWGDGGLRLTGEQSLLFVGASGNNGNNQSGGVVVWSPTIPPFVQPPACPSAPVLRPELLLALDAQYRLIWLARLPSQGSSPRACL